MNRYCKIKTLILFAAALVLSGCEIQRCDYDIEPKDKPAWERTFKSCMADAANGRKGVSYTTNDDEDFDEVIDACKSAALSISGKIRIEYCVGGKK